MAKTNSWIPHIEAFVDASRPSNQQTASLDAIATLVMNDLLTIEALVKEMGLYLTTTDNIIRTRGILLLAELLACLSSKPLDNATIHCLIGFFTDRLADWQALHGALIGCLALLRRKSNYGTVTVSDARAVGLSYLHNIQVQSLGNHDRKLCFEILICLLDRYPEAVVTLGDDLIYGICEAIDGEKDPQCLMLTFHIVEILGLVFPDPFGPLAGFAEDLFDVLGRYFPVHYTHPKNDGFDVKRDDLSRALMLAFASIPLFEPFAMPLLLEKLSSSLPSAKVDSLKYLSHCSVKYGVDRMEKHANAIWSSLKDALFTYLQEPIFSLVSESPNGKEFQMNEIAEEALVCLREFMLQDNGRFLSLVLEDEDIEMTLNSVTSVKRYNDITIENKQKLHAVGCILSVSSTVSSACCNRVFQNFFPRLMDILGLSPGSSAWGCILDDDCVLSEKLNSGALYLCIELLAGCRGLAIGSEEPSSQSISVEDTWYCLLKNFSGPLAGALRYIFVTSTNQHYCEADIYCGVKGLQILSTFPKCFLPISKSIFENILNLFMSHLTAGCKESLLWKLSLKALMQIGTFIEKSHDSEKVICYMTLVVEKLVSLISLDDSTVPRSLQLEAISEIGTAGLDYMLRVIQGLEEAISTNFLEASVKGNLKSVDILVPLLECYSNKVLPWSHKSGGFEDVALHFSVNIWNQIENSTAFNICVKREDLLDKMMTTMRLAVAGCSEDNQGLIVQKAYNILASSTFFPLKESIHFSVPIKLDELLISDSENFSYRDEWIISLFASVIIALCPQTPLPNVRVILKLFMTGLLKGHVPSAQALGSMINKLPLVINSREASSSCTLEEAIDIIFKMGLWSVSGGSLGKCSAMDGSDEGQTNLCCSVSQSKLVQSNAMVGLAWIGKGMVMRGHEKVKDIIMILLRCLLPSSKIIASPYEQDMLGECNEHDTNPVVMRSAADAFHVLLSDSDVCLNKRFHATIRPLYKQHFFSSVMPILFSSLKESDSSTTRSMLYRAIGYIISDSPLAAVVTEAKRLISVLLDGLSMLSVNFLDKDLTYSLLLVLSGILMDENGKEAITENAHIIINCLIGLISYPHMMLVRETTIQCLVAMTGLPYTRIYPMRLQVLQALSKALDDPKRAVRQEAVRCHQAWASIASRSVHF